MIPADSHDRDPHRAGRRAGAAARPSDRGAARLRRAGADPARHRRSRRSRATRCSTRAAAGSPSSCRRSLPCSGSASPIAGPASPACRTCSTVAIRSSTGMGLGLLGARRLTDQFDIETERRARAPPSCSANALPGDAAVSSGVIARVSRELALLAPTDPMAEIRAQNQELLRALEEGRERQGEVERLNQELAETNRGVLALYAELDEKAGDLARASELKSRFLSNISHELRTPLNAILNITGLLIDHVDGPLNAEQDRQVRFVRGAALTLSEMVNDLLDLARIEAGRSVVRVASFTVTDLFAGLRGMFRAITPTERVALVLDDPGGRARARHRRGEAVADSPQPDLQRAQVHRARRGPRERRRRSGRGGSPSSWPIPVSGSRPRTRSGSSRSSPSSRARCSGAPPAPDSASPCRASWRSCSADSSPCRARPASGPPSR